MSYTIRPVVVPRLVNKAGLCTIYHRVLFKGGKDKLFPTTRKVNPTFFDNSTGLALKGDGNSKNINSFLASRKKAIDDFIYDLEKSGKTLTMDHMVKFFSNENTESFIDFCFQQCEEHKPLWSKGHHKTTKCQIQKLQSYKPDLCFSDLNFTFLNQYKKHLLITKKNEINTVNSDFRTMSKFINLAIKSEIMKETPFRHFKIPKEETDPEYLSLDEVRKLTILYHKRTLSNKLQSSLFYFLLSCYTGLRFGDIARDLNKYIIDKKRFKINTGKTNKEVYFDLSKPVLELLNSPDAFMKPLKTNNRVNEDVEELCLKIKVTKDITFHCARHSFAINSLILGIDLFTVSQILGHRDIKTTQIYAKITEALLNNQMYKWDAV